MTSSIRTPRAGSSPTASAPASDYGPPRRTGAGAAPERRGVLGWILAGSIVAGVVAAALLVVAPFVPPTESGVTGAVLCGLALGWVLLAVLSMRFTDRPQRWAFAPALVLGAGGLLLLLFGAPMHRVLDWVWPPALLALAIWMFVRVRRQRGRLLHWVLYPVTALLALAAVGGGIETTGEAVDAQANPMPGRLIDVGGHSLHLHCTGSGSPTVVLEAGGGEMSSNLGWISPAVAQSTRVCVYDRAGRGWSETAASPRHGIQIATDLHTLLHRAGVPGPYVLAGHSFGGLYVMTFAARYPGEVAGMVLIDSTAPKAASPDGAAPSDLVRRLAALASVPARMGLARLYAPIAADGLPAGAAEEYKANVATARNLESTINEYADAGDAVHRAGALTSFGAKPLVVLTAPVGNGAAWFRVQDHLAALSTNSAHRIVDGATHEALVGEKDSAAATTRGILDVVDAVRSGGPLAK